MESGSKVSLIDSDNSKALFTVLTFYQPPLLPLRSVNKAFKERLEEFKAYKLEESKKVQGASHEVVLTSSPESSQVYLKIRELIINPRVNKKVRNEVL